MKCFPAFRGGRAYSKKKKKKKQCRGHGDRATFAAVASRWPRCRVRVFAAWGRRGKDEAEDSSLHKVLYYRQKLLPLLTFSTWSIYSMYA